MLERTAGCLESGSLRRLVPRSERPFKTRRMLHSAFWSHGANELDISSFWTELATERQSGCNSQAQSIQGTSSTSAPALDFLYPLNPLAFLGQYSILRLLERQDSRRNRSNVVRLGQRSYSSATASADAKADSTRLDNTESDAPNDSSDPVVPSKDVLPELRELIKKGGSSIADFEEAWRLYYLLDQNEKHLVEKDLLPYLATSKRRIDAERTVTLFSGLPLDQRNDKRYSAMIRAYLVLDDIPAAIQTHKDAMSSPLVTKDHPSGTDYLIAHLLNAKTYSLAWEAWQRTSPSRRHGRFALWRAVDDMSNLQECALALASYNQKYTLQVTSSVVLPEKQRLSAFTAAVLYRALVPKKQPIDSSKHLRIWRHIQNLNADTADIYETTITKLLESGHTKLASQCYRKFRLLPDTKISRLNLHGILGVFCKNYSIRGMQEVLDDFFRCYQGPTAICYRMCLTEFARQGDVTTVKDLFEQFADRFFVHGQPNNVDELAPLLHVHARRGELNETIAAFDDITRKYGMTPNLGSYNILLSAHAKANDIDGAVSLFDRILHRTSFGPDHYTFGIMMGLCVARGDLEGAEELLLMAEERKVQKTSAMVDTIVLGLVQEGRLLEAENICENALKIKLGGSLVRMWNTLLSAHAMRTDLVNTNRILRRMQDVGLKFDGLTYAALMQVLAISRQPDRAYTILTKVMPAAGIRATNFHYAVVMGGYIAVGGIDKVFNVHNRMLERGILPSTSTHRPVLAASAIQDQADTPLGERLQRADQYFQAALVNMDAQEIVQSPRKGTGAQPLDIALPSAYFDYLIFVYAQRGSSAHVQELYGRYLAALPPNRRNEPSTKILNALMIAKLREKDYIGVSQCWDLIFSQVKEQSIISGTLDSDKSRDPNIAKSREFALSTPLSTYIMSLGEQNKLRELHDFIIQVLELGFKLDNKNWNLYIQTLARKWQYREAFKLCEQKLIDGWTGWERNRQASPGRTKLTSLQRMLGKDPGYLRPNTHTLLFLGRSLLELRATSAEGRAARDLLAEIEESYPKTVSAIRTMPTADSDLENQILRGDIQL